MRFDLNKEVEAKAFCEVAIIHTNGNTYPHHKMKKQVVDRMQPIRFATASPWDFVRGRIEDAVDSGELQDYLNWMVFNWSIANPSVSQ